MDPLSLPAIATLAKLAWQIGTVLPTTLAGPLPLFSIKGSQGQVTVLAFLVEKYLR
jgi:hypothetical protein